MKKLILLIAVILLNTLVVKSQDSMPNANFEYWESGPNPHSHYNKCPVGWSPCTWGSPHAGISQSTDSYSGSYSMVVHNWYCYYPGSIANGLKNVGNTLNGTPLSGKPKFLNGYFKYIPGNIDSSSTEFAPGVNVKLSRFDTTLQKREIVGYGFLWFEPTDTWTAFNVEIKDSMQGAMPDTIVVQFLSAIPRGEDSQPWCGPGEQGFPEHSCHYLYIDALTLSDSIRTGGTGEDDNLTGWRMKVYPNPVNRVLNIELAENVRVQNILLYDIQGRLVRTFDAEDRQLDMHDIAGGQYQLSVITADEYIMRKVIVW